MANTKKMQKREKLLTFLLKYELNGISSAERLGDDISIMVQKGYVPQWVERAWEELDKKQQVALFVMINGEPAKIFTLADLEVDGVVTAVNL